MYHACSKPCVEACVCVCVCVRLLCCCVLCLVCSSHLSAIYFVSELSGHSICFHLRKEQLWTAWRTRSVWQLHLQGDSNGQLTSVNCWYPQTDICRRASLLSCPVTVFVFSEQRICVFRSPRHLAPDVTANCHSPETLAWHGEPL